MVHRVEVARHWIRAGARLSIELPRNLTCAACAGGGCDACRRAGAVTLAERGAPPEVVEVTLGGVDAAPDHASLTMRIPERGGSAASPELPRGLLLLTLAPAAASHPSVRQTDDTESVGDESVSSGPRLRRRVGAGPIALVVLALALAIWFLLRR